MQVAPPRPDLRQHGDGVIRCVGVPNDVAERIATTIADGPESERKPVFGSGRVPCSDDGSNVGYRQKKSLDDVMSFECK